MFTLFSQFKMVFHVGVEVLVFDIYGVCWVTVALITRAWPNSMLFTLCRGNKN